MSQKSSALPRDQVEVGTRGEFVAHVFEKLGSSRVEHGRLADETAPHLVKARCEAWLPRIATPIELDTRAFANTDIVSLTFRRPGALWVTPTNMGFGITYTLPYILGALTAVAGGTLLIENPEAHLHPSGQSEVGIFLAQMAAAGLQIIVETHSDHVINGIRRAIGEHETLTPELATIIFFAAAEAEPEHLSITPTGGISNWPRGLLDQYRFDVARISRIKRKR